MPKHPNRSGQTLVEMAIVLPLFALGIFTSVQLIWCCHNLIELQRMAMVTSDRLSDDSQPSNRTHYLFSSLWGRISPPKEIYDNIALSAPWRPNHGLGPTVQDEGRMMGVTLQSDLFPGQGFTRGLDTVNQKATAERLLEPAIPEEK